MQCNIQENAVKESLTQTVLTYKETGKGWNDLSDRISLYIYDYPGNWTDWDEDKCSDFFLSFLPKISGLIRRFRPDYSFETYLSSSLRWYMKTFTERQAGREHYECWAIEAAESQALQISELDPLAFNSYEENVIMDSPEDCPFELEINGRLKDPILRRRLLYAVLLRTADVDVHRIPVIARLVDVDPDWLFERTEKARSLVSVKIHRREKLRQRRNECWYQLDGARKRIEGAFDSDRQGQWEKKARTWRNRYMTACHGIRKMNITPSHREIGRLLDVPPGTISSGLHFLRKTWNSM